MIQTKQLARFALLTALALVLSWLEAQLPVFFAVPGMKLGLANLVVLVTLYLSGSRQALLLNLLRIALAALLFGNTVSLLYSLVGGLLSFLVMALLKKTGRFSQAAVSVAGGISHNVGQLLAAMLLLETAALGWYLLILWFTGFAAGAGIGLIGSLLSRRLKALGWGTCP